ncbi:hypothetical protein D3C87_917650 [compost metagenome]
MAHPVDLLVDRGFFLDEGVGARHIGFRLVIIVVGDEIFHRIVGEEVLELRIELRGQRLVRRENDSRALRRLNYLGHGEGLAGAGDAEQDLAALAGIDAFHEVVDGRRLVACGLIVRGHADGNAAFGLRRPGRAVRRPQLAVLEQRIAALDQLRQRVHRCGDGARREVGGILQRYVHTGDRIEAGGGAGFRIARCADGNTARGLGGRGVLGRLRGGLLRVLARFDLDLLAVLARLRGDFALGFHGGCLRFRLKLLHPIGDAAAERRTFE